MARTLTLIFISIFMLMLTACNSSLVDINSLGAKLPPPSVSYRSGIFGLFGNSHTGIFRIENGFCDKRIKVLRFKSSAQSEFQNLNPKAASDDVDCSDGNFSYQFTLSDLGLNLNEQGKLGKVQTIMAELTSESTSLQIMGIGDNGISETATIPLFIIPATFVDVYQDPSQSIKVMINTEIFELCAEGGCTSYWKFKYQNILLTSTTVVPSTAPFVMVEGVNGPALKFVRANDSAIFTIEGASGEVINYTLTGAAQMSTDVSRLMTLAGETEPSQFCVTGGVPPYQVDSTNSGGTVTDTTSNVVNYICFNYSPKNTSGSFQLTIRDSHQNSINLPVTVGSSFQAKMYVDGVEYLGNGIALGQSFELRAKFGAPPYLAEIIEGSNFIEKVSESTTDGIFISRYKTVAVGLVKYKVSDSSVPAGYSLGQIQIGETLALSPLNSYLELGGTKVFTALNGIPGFKFFVNGELKQQSEDPLVRTYSFTPTTIGTYLVKVADANGNESTGNIIVYNKLLLTILSSLPADSMSSISASGGQLESGQTYKFKFNNNIVNSTFRTPTTPGTYKASVEDSLGNIVEQDVFVYGPLVLTLDKNQFVKGGSVLATASGGSGVGYSVTLTSGTATIAANSSNTFSLTSNTVGNFTVNLKDSFGGVGVSKTVTVYEVLSLGANVLEVHSQESIALTATGGYSTTSFSSIPVVGSFSNTTYIAPLVSTQTGVTLKATDLDSNQANLAVTVYPVPTLATVTGSNKVSRSSQIELIASGGKGPYSLQGFSVSPSEAGTVVLNGGKFYFTPNQILSSPSQAVISVQDQLGMSVSLTLNITNPLALTCNISQLQIGSSSMGVCTATGGSGIYTFSSGNSSMVVVGATTGSIQAGTSAGDSVVTVNDGSENVSFSVSTIPTVSIQALDSNNNPVTSLAENSWVVKFKATLNGTSTKLISVPFTTGGSLTGASLSTAGNNVFSFAAGSTDSIVTVSFNDDATYNGDKDFAISLSTSLTNVALGNPSSASVNLVDDDPMVTSISPVSGPQSGGTNITAIGKNLTKISNVTIGGVTCIVSGSTANTSLSCDTGASASYGTMNVEFNYSYMSTAQKVVLVGGFTYTQSTSGTGGDTGGGTTGGTTGGGTTGGNIYTLEPVSVRTEANSIWTGGRMIVWGGSDSSGALNTGAQFDPIANAWSSMSTTGAPSARYGAGAGWTGSKMLIIGGENNGTFYNNGALYDPAANTWSVIDSAPSAFYVRRNPITQWIGDRMFIYGGHTGTGGALSAISNGIQFYPNNAPGSQFGLTIGYAGSPTTFNGRSAASSVWTGKQMFVWGGIYGITSFRNDGAYYDFNQNKWILMTASPLEERSHASTAFDGRKLYIWGGLGYANSAYKTFNDGAVYDTETALWSMLSTSNLSPRHSARAFFTGLDIMFVGGVGPGTTSQSDPNYRENGANLFADVSVYNLANQTWSPVSSTGYTARRRPAMTYSGREVIVVGGKDSSGTFLNDVIKINKPTTFSNTWVATTPTTSSSTGYSLPAVWGHTAVWTGSKMMIWGGRGLDSYGYDFTTNDGYTYDPIANSFVNIPDSLATVPTPRQSHSAVWTGTNMIVFGGRAPIDLNGNYEYYNDGSKYDPVTNSWTKLSVSNAPRPRGRHTAIWTGSKMLIYGGRGLDDYSQSQAAFYGGFLYNPSTDTWKAADVDGMMLGRWGHTAIWTGKYMVVFGGTYGNTELPNSQMNSGGRFDPEADLDGFADGEWLSMENSNAPLVRVNHSAIWTGNHMIVWGGVGNGVNHDSGAYYDPEANTWKATALPPAGFVGREYHSAVWTGNSMLVLGGEKITSFAYGDSQSLNTGYIFEPYTSFETGGTWVRAINNTGFGARAGHTAVWTGATGPANGSVGGAFKSSAQGDGIGRMIIWGGWQTAYDVYYGYYLNGYNTGAVYQP